MLTRKVLFFDIESTNLAANYGYIICISYKWAHEKKVHTISIDQFSLFKQDPTNDINVVREFKKVYEEADMVVAHYGKKFDLPMINTRLLMHKLQPLPNTKLYDTWRVAKDRLKLNSNRLATLIASLGVKYQKTPLSGPIWIKAMSGNRGAIKYVIEHCVYDVLALEAVYKILSVLTTEAYPMFHACKNPKYKSEGLRVCDKKIYRRLYCLKCGGFFKGQVLK